MFNLFGKKKIDAEQCDSFLIAGLGNPGSKYENTRHNIGYRVIDELSVKSGIPIKKLKFKAVIGEGKIGISKVVLAKPTTFMNNSGESIREIVSWMKIPYNNVVIIYDDIDLELGTLRIRKSGSAGTHNGMRSILEHLKTQEFPRIRLGIGRPHECMNLADFVLSKFSKGDEKAVSECIKRASKAAEVIVREGIEPAMREYN